MVAFILLFSISGSHSVVSNSLRPYGLYPARLLFPWNSPGENTGVVANSYSTESSQPRDQTCVSCTAGRFFTIWATRCSLPNTECPLISFGISYKGNLPMSCYQIGISWGKENARLLIQSSCWSVCIIHLSKIWYHCVQSDSLSMLNCFWLCNTFDCSLPASSV